MEQPKSQTAFDPSRSPFTTPAATYTYLDLENPDVPTKKITLKINSNTLRVEKIDGRLYPQAPMKVPQQLMDVPQPHIHTCGMPSVNGGNAGLGCESAVGGGCPILARYGRIGPVNIIIEKEGRVNSAPCHSFYCGISENGWPVNQVHLLTSGFNPLTDRTVIPENVIDPITKREVVRFTEVPNLAPWYEEAKVGRFSTTAAPEKKRGRPKGSKNGTSAAERRNRESLPSPQA